MSTAPRFIEHVTLTTGRSRRSLASEVAPEALEFTRDIIRRMTTGDAAESVPIFAGYAISGRAAGRCLVATVWPTAGRMIPIATIGVAAHSLCGAKLWRELHRWGETPVMTDAERCPPEPWVAAVLDTGIAEHMDATKWLGDFERCLAWGWLAELGAR